MKSNYWQIKEVWKLSSCVSFPSAGIPGVPQATSFLQQFTYQPFFFGSIGV
jgi:hypothetical protein